MTRPKVKQMDPVFTKTESKADPKDIADPKVSFSSKTSRNKLPPKNAFYWMLLDKGKSLGYRRGTNGEGSWCARVFFPDGTTPQQETFAKADDLKEADDDKVLTYSQARKQAEAWCDAKLEAFKAQSPSPDAKPMKTVGDALRSHLTVLESQSLAPDGAARNRIEKTIEEIGNIDLLKLTRQDLLDWRQTLIETAPRVRAKVGAEPAYRKDFDPQDPEHRRQRMASANRALTDIKTALTTAMASNPALKSDLPWRTLKAFGKTKGTRNVVLDRSEQVRFLNACTPEFRPLGYAGLLTGGRYGELRHARVKDVLLEDQVLRVRGKTGERFAPLIDEALAVFASIVEDRDPEEFLFLRANGLPWEKSLQQDPMEMARLAVNPKLTFYGLRHTTITTWILHGIEIPVIAKAVGTSETIIQDHYAHLRAEWIGKKINDKAPRIGAPEEEIQAILAKLQTKRGNRLTTEESFTFTLRSLHPRSYLGKIRGGTEEAPPPPDRPTKEQLATLVLQMSLCKIAEQYHVSETIIRKLCKRFEIKTFPPGYWAKVYAHEGRAPKAGPSDPPRPNTEESQAYSASKTPTTKLVKS